MRKKVALLFAAAFAMAMLVPATAFAASDTNIEIEGGKYKITDDEMSLPENMSYDRASNTLTLNNYHATTKSFIYSDNDLNIVLIGDNSMQAVCEPDPKYWAMPCEEYGITCNGRLSIKGGGTLSINADKHLESGIEAEERIDISGVTINIKSSTATTENGFYGISLRPWWNKFCGHDDSAINISNAVVNIDSMLPKGSEWANVGIDVQDADLSITNSKVNVNLTNGGERFTIGVGLLSSRDDKVYGGKLTIDGNSDVVANNGDMYFYTDDIRAPHFYMGEAAPGTKVSKSDCFKDSYDIDGRIESKGSYTEMSTHKWAVNPGDVITPATATADGKAKYTDATTGATKVAAIPRASEVKLAKASLAYNGKAQSASVVVKDANGATLKSGTDYAVTVPKGRKAVGSYTYKVSFKGKYSGTKSLKLKIVPKATAISKVVAGKKSFKVKWKKLTSANATDYQVRYSLKSDMSGAKTVTVKGYLTTAKTVSKLKAGKKYYVQVRAYKAVGSTKYYSAWSAKKSVKTK